MHPFSPGRPYCPLAWQPPLGLAPAWRRLYTRRSVEGEGVRELLRRAQLPCEELRHMGAWPALLDGLQLWVPDEAAATLLGRIVLDDREAVWSPELRPEALRLGLDVLQWAFR